MANTLKVRDRTTNKVRDVLVDQEDYERLKDYKYLTDKNSKEPFREDTVAGKRQRIALKRDVMGFTLGDPRRVCYIDKSNVFDCRKTNLKCKSEEEAKVVATDKPKSKRGRKKKVVEAATTPVLVVKHTSGSIEDTTKAEAPAETPVEAKANIVLPDSLDLKRSLLAQLDETKVLELVSVEDLLSAWAETHGYEKKAV